MKVVEWDDICMRDSVLVMILSKPPLLVRELRNDRGAQ